MTLSLYLFHDIIFPPIFILDRLLVHQTIKTRHRNSVLDGINDICVRVQGEVVINPFVVVVASQFFFFLTVTLVLRT